MDPTQANRMTDDEWKQRLSPEQFEVLRKHGTEPAFTGKYWNEHGDGIYRCAGCETELFKSDTKFDSGTGWPSFTEPIAEDVVEYVEDKSFGMVRVEVRCGTCGGHLGHVFNDGPKDAGGQRFCMNSCALDLEKDD
jgi:peptide-methionine (R)-S-oxide reductase